MTGFYVFVESQTNAALLRALLPEETTREAELVVTRSRGGLWSSPRSYLRDRPLPVAVLRDAHSLELENIQDQQSDVETLLRMGVVVPKKLVTAVPSALAWFFAAPEAVERVMGTPLPDGWAYLGTRDPKGVLQLLEQRTGVKWDADRAIAALDAHDLERMRRIPAVVELTTFLDSVRRPALAKAT